MELWRLIIPVMGFLAIAVNARADESKDYSGIGPGHPRWAERLEDALRYQLLNHKFVEAFRITELVRRLGTDVSSLGYYRALAATKAGSCTLNLSAGPKQWQRLLRAHQFRFSHRFHSQALDEADQPRSVLSFLTYNQTHFLEDIPSLQLLRGRGCRFQHDTLEDSKRAKDAEFDELRDWYEAQAEPPLQGTAEVELRLLELAIARKSTDLATKLTSQYNVRDPEVWRKIAEPERSFIWQQLIATEQAPPPPYPADSPEGKVVQAIILTTKDVTALSWLALLDLTKVPQDQKLALTHHLLSFDHDQHRDFLFMIEAEDFYRRGKMTEALANIRRIVLTQDMTVETTIQERATNLAMLIFTEYRYDEAMLGAIQNTLPVEAWAMVFRNLLMDHSLAGNRVGAERILTIATGRNKGALRLTVQESTILDSLRARQTDRFAKELASLRSARSLSSRWLTFFRDLASRVIALNAEQYAAVKSYCLQIAEMLREQNHKATQGETKLVDLIAIYDRDASSEWSQGAAAVRQGTVQAGVIDLSIETPIENPFKWNPTPSLPLRELLVQPVAITSRDWKIE